MRILTNPGSNLPRDLIERYGISLLPQQVVVDGVSHDTRDGIAFEEIDRWVHTAKARPYVVGTTAAEFALLARTVAAEDRALVGVMTSRKIIGSHDAAVIGARMLQEQKGFHDLSIHVADTGVTDVGSGLACVLAAQAAEAGLELAEVGRLLEAFRTSARMAFTVASLEYLVKGGRATAFRAFMANLLGKRPVIAFNQGELQLVSTMSVKSDSATVVAGELAKGLEPGERVFAAVFHGGAETQAHVLAKTIEAQFRVDFMLVRPLSASIYLHAGPGTVGGVVVPLRALPWQPTA